MTDITLNVVKGNTNDHTKTNPFTIKVENKTIINSVITMANDNTITESQMKKLQEVAARGGDLGVLEKCDLSPKETIEYANTLGFSKYYDIKLSADGKYFQVTVKDAGAFVKNPNLGNIKHDFGVRNNVFVSKGYIPHGNEDVIENAKISIMGKNYDYDTAIIEAGKTINIPVGEVHLNDSPDGFWARLFN